TTAIQIKGENGYIKSSDIEKQHFKNQGRIRRDDSARSCRSVAKGCRYNKSALAADLHGHDPFIPTRNDLPCSDYEHERLVLVQRAVELLSVRQPAGIMNNYFLSGRR